MNERIKQLADKIWAEEYWINPNTDKLLPAQLNKFAELIVRECARVIDRGDGEMSSMAETIWCNVCRDDILKHFGVEE